MVDTAQHIATAKQIVKDQFGIDIEVEFVNKIDLEKRMAELEKLYGRKADGLGGLFMPAANGLPPIIVVGYDAEHPLEFIEVYCHELQHAIDYFEVLQELGQEFVTENFCYFVYYTELNASQHGILRQTVAFLERMPQNEQQAYIADCKDHAKKVFAKWTKPSVVDVLYYLSKVAAFAQIEGRQDDTMLAVVPQANKFINILNITNRYQPTRDWYGAFKKLIDGLTIKQ